MTTKKGERSHIFPGAVVTEVGSTAASHRWRATFRAHGLLSNGRPAETLAEQALIAWKSVLRLLHDSGISSENVVSIHIAMPDFDEMNELTGLLEDIGSFVKPSCSFRFSKSEHQSRLVEITVSVLVSFPEAARTTADRI